MVVNLFLILLSVSPQEDFRQAVEAYKKGLYTPALYAMEQLLLEPEFNKADSALFLAGQAAFQLDRYEKALRYLERHMSEAPYPLPKALENAVISALELNQVDKAYELFSSYPRFDLSQNTKLRLAKQLEDKKDYKRARDLYAAINDPEIRLVGAKMLIAASRFDLLSTYLADLEQTYPEVAATIASLQIEATLSRGDSLSSLEAGLAMGTPRDVASTEAFNLGELFSSFDLYEDAVQYYSSAVKNRRYDALLPLAHSYAALGQNHEAVKTFDKARKKGYSLSAKDASVEARVRLLAGKTFNASALNPKVFRTYEEYVQALELLKEKKQDDVYGHLLSSSSFLRGEDILRRARLLSKQGRVVEALESYRQYIEKVPFGNERTQAAKELSILLNFQVKDPQAALNKLIMATTPSEKGKILFEDAKDYKAAISFLDTISTAQAFYYSALSYERLYQKEGKVKYLDKARERYQNLCWQFPEDSLVEDGFYRLFITEIRDPLKRMDRGLDYLDHYPDGKYADEIRFKIGYVHLSRGDTVSAKSDWETLYLTKPKSEFNFPVLFELAKLALAEADTADAAAKLSLIVSVAPRDTLYYLASSYLARLEEARGRNLQALVIYRNMAQQLGYLPRKLWKRSLNLLFTLKQYNELRSFYKALGDREYRNEIDFWQEVAKVERGVVSDEDLKELFHTRPPVLKDPYLYWAAIGASSLHHDRLGRHLFERLVAEGQDSTLIAKAEFLLAQIQIAGGEDSSAVATLRKLHAASPNDTLIMSKLVLALYRSGKIDEADSFWLKLDLMSTSDQSPILLEKVAYLLTANRIDEADTVLTKLANVRFLWKNADFLYYKGLVDARKGRTVEAMDIYLKFISEFPSSERLPAVYFKMGTLFYMQQELDSASTYYLKALDSPDLRIPALENLAKIARSQRQWDRSLQYFEVLARETSDSQKRGEILVQMGVTAYNAAKFTRALEYFNKAIPLVVEKGRARLLYWNARAHAAFADPEHIEQAIALFLQCHEEFPQDQWGLESWLMAGEGYLQLERYEDAKVIFKAIIAQRGENDPFGMRARTYLDKL